jgi:hypothetical protein
MRRRVLMGLRMGISLDLFVERVLFSWPFFAW